jgi:hypothetical protein
MKPMALFYEHEAKVIKWAPQGSTNKPVMCTSLMDLIEARLPDCHLEGDIFTIPVLIVVHSEFKGAYPPPLSTTPPHTLTNEGKVHG